MPKQPLCLIVEDEPIYVTIITDILESLGYRTRAAGSEREAVGLLKRVKPALVVMDIHLHGQACGLDIIRAIRSGKRNGSVPIIGVSAAELCEMRSGITSRGAGMDAFVSKLRLVGGLAEAVRKVAA